MVDFSKLADKKLEEVERPPLAPIGHYRFKVAKMPEMDVNPDSEWYIIEFQCQALEALDDVDPDALAEYGKVTNIQLRKTFMCDREDEKAADQMLFNVKRFLIDHLGCADESMSLKEALAQSPGAEFTGQVVHKQDKNDKELFHANLGRTGKAE